MHIKYGLINQIDQRIKSFFSGSNLSQPEMGWIHFVRTSLGMSLQQMGNKLSKSRQSIHEMEIREKEGSITLKGLKEAAEAMNMRLVYAFVPNDESVSEFVQKRAKELASEIVMRTNQTMILEDQSVSYERLEAAIEERTQELLKQNPKKLWG